METRETSAKSLISLDEAAEIANVSRVHVWRLVQRGEIEGYRVGDGHGPIRVDRRAFTEWLYGEPDQRRT